MFSKIQEAESASLATFEGSSNPNLSESEVVIISGGGSGGGGGGNGSLPTERVLRQKVIGPTTAAANRILRKSTTKCKRRFPMTMIQILVLGASLLILILMCIVLETYFSSKHPLSGSSSQHHYEEHSSVDKKYHEQLVAEVNSNPKAKWRAVYNKFATRAVDSSPILDKIPGWRLIILFKDSLKAALTKNMQAHEWSKEQMFADTEDQLKSLLSLKEMALPKSFDAREKWLNCWSVHHIVNQGGCGSCWAMASTSVMSDRTCIHSNGTRQPQISAQDLLECCPHCGGCRGTVWALFSFVYWKGSGIVSGGDYGSYQGCKPYGKSADCGSPCSIDVYNNAVTGSGATTIGLGEGGAEQCWALCQPTYDRTYQEDVNRARAVYWIKPNTHLLYTHTTMDKVDAMLKKENVTYSTLIKRELLLNGPMIGCFVVYDEFQHYRSGIYSSMTSPTSKELYGHCAKLIGWGVEGGEEYWLYANTWGRGWGENGYFRVAIREVPEEAAAGLPLV